MSFVSLLAPLGRLKVDTHISRYYNSLRWLEVDGRKSYFVGCLFFGVIRLHLPNYLRSNLVLGANARKTRMADDVLIIHLDTLK